MPTPRIIPLTIDAHIRWVQENQRCENVLQFGYTVVPTAATLGQLATELAGSIVPKMQILMHQSCTFVEIRCDDIGGLGRSTATYPFPAGVNGLRGGEALPANVAANMVLKTGLRGRNKQGAKRIGGLEEGETAASDFLSFFLTYLINLATEYLLTRVSGSYIPVVASLKYAVKNPLRSVALMDYIVDSQKTRLPGRGT